MSLLVIEGFENLGTSGNLPQTDGKFTINGSNWQLSTGRLGGLSCKVITSSSGHDLRWTIPATTSFVVGFAIRVQNMGSTNKVWQGFDTGSGGLSIDLTSAGALRVNRTVTALATSANGAMVTNTWYYLELVATIDNSGSFELFKNGVSLLNGSGVDTQAQSNTYIDSFRFNGVGAGALYEIDDFYFLDTSGSVNNSRLGPSKVVNIVPASDSGTNQWTTSSGSNHYDRVNQNPSDGDTTYVESTTTGQIDMFNCNDPNAGTVYGLQMNSISKSSGGSPTTILHRVESGASSDDGSALTPGGSYANVSRIVEVDPNTSAPWTGLALAAAKFGVKVP